MEQLDHYFKQSKAFPKIEVEKGFRFIEYRSYEHSKRVQVWSAQHFIVFVLQGKKVMEAGGAKYQLGSDEALFLRKGSYLMSEIPKKQGVFQSVLFFLDEPFLEQFAQRHADLLPSPNQASQAPAIRLHITEPVGHFYHAVLPYFNTPLNEARRRGLTLKLEELLLNLIAEPQNESFALFLNGLLQDKPTIESVMEQNFMLNLPLAQFAQLAQRSLSSFKRDFKAAFDSPPGKWLHTRRLKHAARLLEHDMLSVTQIALESGFEDLSHFSAAFKAAYGYSPSVYRKRAAVHSL